jgi:2,4-dienoyl-CoA reductase-like NADH-dependent reductase (Old Yellow Enzyme family)
MGEDRLAIRLTPFDLYNEARGTQTAETWGHLRRELRSRMNISYVHFIEPKYEQVHSVEKRRCKSDCSQIVDPKLSST